MDSVAGEVPKDEQIADLLRRLHAAETDHHNACELVAKMHAAAMGSGSGPARGVVEDVAALKADRDALEARLKLATEHIVWCGGADDFAPQGKAREGWLKGPGAFLDEQLAARPATAKPAPHCCLPGCGKPAEYGIWPDPSHGPDMATEACEAHVGALLYEGINSVHPVGDAS